ncbi:MULTISPECIES: hypothetical protein [unclassified Streptomyces]|uniref:hypothetical protein n=1 Tax=unclassified Streptomyces TaxID=2593676 RepID=UPI0022578E77|nr:MULTISPECIES: hypothetical protein [unclassified Streptomyces]MCX4871087.1 hypothetical protein [Streptomyces sp. NBC_00906]MCX4902685.1 hypothetical protein [Streptomyces sp. NBC_00892]
MDSSPGVELLLSIGAWKPEFLLTGPALRDQGLMVTGLLEAGWPREHLRQVIAGRPLPDPLHRTVGAVVSARLRAAASMPVPHLTVGTVPHQAPAPDLPWTDQPPAPATPTPPTWSERQEQDAQLRRGADAQRGCDGDDRMCSVLAVVGETLCPEHLGWPLCPGGCTRRTPDGAMCATCVEQMQLLSAEAIEAEPTDDGTCPGHAGVPCGRPVLVLGLCGRCRMRAQEERDRVEAEWQAAVAEAVATAATAATAAAAEAAEAHAPF